jgi:hypothetical protein
MVYGDAALSRMNLAPRAPMPPSARRHSILRHRIRERSGGLTINLDRGAVTEDDIAVDAALWFVLAAMIGLIGCGGVFTASDKKRIGPRS